MKTKTAQTSRQVKSMGLMMIGLGVLGVLSVIFESAHFNHPPDFGSQTAYVVLMIAGILGLIVSSSIKNLENRLDRIAKD